MEENIIKRKAKDYILLLFGITLMAVGIYFFKAPRGFATGGVSGISIILSNLFPVMSQATYMLIINVLLLLAGLVFLGRELGVMTFICSMTLSLENQLFDLVFAIDGPLTNHPLLELIYAVLLTGIGSAIIFKCKASSGGTDIVALILKKKTSLNVGTALLLTDLLIALSTFLHFGEGGVSLSAETGLFSLLGLFAKVFVVDDVIDSMNLCKSFTIITTKEEEINDYITHSMKHSATVIRGIGAYTGDGKSVIMTVCRRSEAIKLRKTVSEIDPKSFSRITKTSEILGKGFRDNVN